MVKSYLKYVPDGSFGIVSSHMGNLIAHQNGKYIIVPALENVHVWDLKQGNLVESWKDEDMKDTLEVTCIAKGKTMVAVGYTDGSIRIWNTQTLPAQYQVTFHGHRSAITCLSFDKSDHRLVSGSKDTDIIVWDILGEVGLYRFKGHKDQITGLSFLEREGLNHIISVSKDTLLKIWDLATQFCVETLVAHRSEVWSLGMHPNELVFITTASDDDVRVWKIDTNILKNQLNAVDHKRGNDSSGEDKLKRASERQQIMQDSNMERDYLKIESCIQSKDVIKRSSKERSVSCLFHPEYTNFFAIQSADKTVEIFKMLSLEEIKKKQSRRRKRQKEKILLKSKADRIQDDSPDNGIGLIDAYEAETWSLQDEINQITILRASTKIRSFDFFTTPLAQSSTTVTKDKFLNIVCGLTNNTVEFYQVFPDNKEEPYQLKSSLDRQGHSSDVRALALSADDDLVVSGSSNSLKLWNTKTRNCIKTMDSGYILSVAFVPGHKHVIAGTKTGDLEIYDLSSSSLLESIQAHDGPIWSIEVRPDKCGLTTGSADKQVKFWDFQLVEDAEYSRIAKRLTLSHVRTLKMSDDILCVKHSHDGRLIAVSLLDSTVKVFYYDSLKFFLSLYGHKLPVLCMDISSDGTLIATGSADKTIKIWGLDFGDCHRSLLAHNDSIMNLKFVWGTHYLFSVSKDKTLKYWDMDKFEQIMKLCGHHGEVWALAVGKYGNIVLSGSHDRSIRIFRKTDDQLFIEEEKEREMEEMFEQQVLSSEEKYNRPIGSGADEDENMAEKINLSNGNDENSVSAPTKKTSESLTWGERITDALEVWNSENKALEEYEKVRIVNPQAAPPPHNPYILASQDPTMSAEAFVLQQLERIPASYLEEALLSIPFHEISMLLICLKKWILKQIISSSSSKTVLLEIQGELKKRIEEYQKKLGFNLAAIKFLKREIDLSTHIGFWNNENLVESPEDNTKSNRPQLKRKIIIN